MFNRIIHYRLIIYNEKKIHQYFVNKLQIIAIYFASGMPGEPGVRGLAGIMGAFGPKGYVGEPGLPSYAFAAKGDFGNRGHDGFSGIKGLPGEPGYIGIPGFKVNKSHLRKIIIIFQFFNFKRNYLFIHYRVK